MTNNLYFVIKQGSRMEAMSFGKECAALNRNIVEGSIYDFISVNFMSTDDIDLYHLWTIRSDYYVKICPNTEVRPTENNIKIPLYPRSFVEFENIIVLRHRTFTGTSNVF